MTNDYLKESIYGYWVTDDVMSGAIDAGDPNSDWGGELWPHGKRINMGAYGGTAAASMSLNDAGNAADFDNDGWVGGIDMGKLLDVCLAEKVLLKDDIERNGKGHFFASAEFEIDKNW